MSLQSARFVLTTAALLIGLYALEPYVRAYFFTATAPRAIEARGGLADFERTSITLFERVSPSVDKSWSLMVGRILLREA